MPIIGTIYPNNMNKFFIDTIQEISMEQTVDFPTRLELELVFTTHPSLVNECKPLPGIGDHAIILIDKIIEVTRSKTPRHKIYVWKSANTDELRKDVKHQTDKFMLSTFNWIDDMWSTSRTSYWMPLENMFHPCWLVQYVLTHGKQQQSEDASTGKQS